MKRIAIIRFLESLLGSPRKRPDWTLLMIIAGIALTTLMLIIR